MKNNDARRIIAEFLTNIGVAWFAAGVIGVFVGNTRTSGDIALSLIWGSGLSIVSLMAAIRVITSKKKRGTYE